MGEPLTAKDLADLVQQYTRVPVPPCRVCGEELAIGRMGGGALTEWVCSSKAASDSLYTTPYQPDNHYSRSRWTQPNHSDSRVVRLVDQYIALLAEKVASD